MIVTDSNDNNHIELVFYEAFVIIYDFYHAVKLWA